MTQHSRPAPSPAPLRVERLAREACQALAPVLPALARADRDLCRQLRRAATSAALNVAEAQGLRAGHRRERLATALGSAREARMALLLAADLGLLPAERLAHPADRFDHLAASLYRLLYPRR